MPRRDVHNVANHVGVTVAACPGVSQLAGANSHFQTIFSCPRFPFHEIFFIRQREASEPNIKIKQIFVFARLDLATFDNTYSASLSLFLITVTQHQWM